jgi:acetyl-CoA C-acetyltransferase
LSADSRAACIVGVARRTWHRDDPEVVAAGGLAPEPLDMWHDVARTAADDAGVPDALAALESIDVVYSQSWQYDDAVGRLAGRLGASPQRGHYSGIGGSVPHVLVTEVARDMAAVDLDLALVVGAEALATVRALKKAGEKPHWSFRPAEKRPFPMDMEFDPSEISHAVFEAYLTFALFDNARRAHLGRELDAHRTSLGTVMSRMTDVAAASPHAWFPVARAADEIAGVSADNRMVAYPYTKLMTSIMDIDMAAALVIASAEKADELGVPEEKRVYLRGSGYAEDPAHAAGHAEMWRSPGLAAASSTALAGAGIGVDDVAHFDLYSCFASSICFALDTLGLAENDPRGVTVTGGLPYHGGPGSNYMTHSLAAMAEVLRADPGSFGLVSGVGMHMQKHAFGVWSTTPPSTAPSTSLAAAGERRGEPESGRGTALPTGVADAVGIVSSASGHGTVAAYTVLHGRDGTPERAVLVCDLPEGGRSYALLDGGSDALAQAEREELVGRQVILTPKDGVNLARVG